MLLQNPLLNIRCFPRLFAQVCRRWVAGGFILLLVAGSAQAQELEPRAYSPSPTGYNIVVVTDTYSYGDVTFDPSLPVSDAVAHINLSALGYLRTLDVAGRSASAAFALPYARGDLDGLYLGEPTSVYRSGIGDPRLRFVLNVMGGPAMTPKEFAARQPATLIGVSLVVSVPLGQYDSSKLVNIGANRWGFKPEVGISRAFGRWTLEGAAGAWIYTDNTDFKNGKTRSQDPVTSLQWHVIYTLRPRMWVALDANYFSGGQTSVDGRKGNDVQRNSRMGATFALPITKEQSLKFAYSQGAITNIGADFKSFGIAWQCAWRDKH
jgi:hypothetical protein